LRESPGMREVLPGATVGVASETGERWAEAIGEILLRLSYPQNLKRRCTLAIRARSPTVPAVGDTFPTAGVSQNKIGIPIAPPEKWSLAPFDGQCHAAYVPAPAWVKLHVRACISGEAPFPKRCTISLTNWTASTPAPYV
jgi:hypothetical protein